MAVYKTIQNVSNRAEQTIILDIDGVLVPDGMNTISSDVFTYITQLKQSHTVCICSNGEKERTWLIAQKLGVSVLDVHKPWGTLQPHSDFKCITDAVIVGDKYITDGLFAKRFNIPFVKVDHLRSVTDSLYTQIIYMFDDIAWFFVCMFKIMRPFQWIKNILIFAPLFFAGGLLYAHSARVFLAVGIFSLSASFVYVINDYFDYDQDRQHPRKKNRPFASGDLSCMQMYLILGFIFVCITLLLFFIPVLVLPVVLYIGMNILYSLWIKHNAVIDVVVVSSFYIIRIIVGGLSGQVPLSPWILLCVFFGALFIVFGKRRAEYGREIRREVLNEYSEGALDYMFIISSGLAIMTYGIYTVIGHTSHYLVYSTVFIVIALFRVLNRIYTHPEQAESPEVLVFTDPVVLGSFVGWVLYVFWIFY